MTTQMTDLNFPLSIKLFPLSTVYYRKQFSEIIVFSKKKKKRLRFVCSEQNELLPSDLSIYWQGNIYKAL